MAVQVLTVEEMKEKVGSELGVSDWLQIDQERINQFAECTLDDQWIHVDEAAAAKGPFGKTIAHGYLTVSLLSHFSAQHTVMPADCTMAINYGMNRLRLLSPVAVGSRIRDRITLSNVEEKPAGILVTTTHTVEIEGQEKPALVAETLGMFFTAG